MAEELIPRLRVADWLDRAEAAQRQLEHLDLRDLRSVVAASDDPVVARDESTRELAAALKAALVTKQDEELTLWLADVEAALDVGRVVRALRLSSVPPEGRRAVPAARSPARLGEATTASLQPPTGPTAGRPCSRRRRSRRCARSSRRPRRRSSAATSCVATVQRLGPLLPQVAALFEIEVAARRAVPKPLRPTTAPSRDQEGRPQARPSPRQPPPPPDARGRAGVAGRGAAPRCDRRRAAESAAPVGAGRRGRAAAERRGLPLTSSARLAEPAAAGRGRSPAERVPARSSTQPRSPSRRRARSPAEAAGSSRRRRRSRTLSVAGRSRGCRLEVATRRVAEAPPLTASRRGCAESPAAAPELPARGDGAAGRGRAGRRPRAECWPGGRGADCRCSSRAPSAPMAPAPERVGRRASPRCGRTSPRLMPGRRPPARLWARSRESPAPRVTDADGCARFWSDRLAAIHGDGGVPVGADSAVCRDRRTVRGRGRSSGRGSSDALGRLPSAAMSDIVTYEADGRVALITLNRRRPATPSTATSPTGWRRRSTGSRPTTTSGSASSPPTPRARSVRCSAPAPTSRRSTPATARRSAPSAAGSPASSTASAASRSSSPSTGWPRPAAARSSSPPTSSSPRPARRSASPRSSATSSPAPAACSACPGPIGQAAAMEAILTGEPIPAERAYDLGLVSRLVEPGEAVAEARRLAEPDLPQRPARRLGEPRRRARRGLRGRRDAEADDRTRRWAS